MLRPSRQPPRRQDDERRLCDLSDDLEIDERPIARAVQSGDDGYRSAGRECGDLTQRECREPHLSAQQRVVLRRQATGQERECQHPRDGDKPRLGVDVADDWGDEQ